MYRSLYFSYIYSLLPSSPTPLSCWSLFFPQVEPFLFLCHIHVCIGFFSCCWDKICWQKQLKGARLYFGSIVEWYSPSWRRRHAPGRNRRLAGHLVTILRKQSEMEAINSQRPSPVTHILQWGFSPRDSTTFPNRDTSWGPSIQIHELWGKFHIKTTVVACMYIILCMCVDACI